MKTLAQTVSRTNYTNLDESKWKKKPRWKGYILGGLVVACILMVMHGKLQAHEFENPYDPEPLLEYNRSAFGDDVRNQDFYQLGEPCTGFILDDVRTIDLRDYPKVELKWKKKNSYKNSITDRERQEMIKLRDYHLAMALNYYNQAESRCWYLPTSERIKAKHWFSTIVAIVMPLDAKAKAITALLTFITDYGNNCIDEWYNIKDMLEKSQMHYEHAATLQSCLDYYKK